MIPVRAERRVRVGDLLVLEFENEETLRYQVQEMVYTERLTAPADVAHEVEAYSRLLPGSHVLTATVFIELQLLATVREELERLTIPFAAVRSFADPSVNFALEFASPDIGAEKPAEGKAPVPLQVAPAAAATEPAEKPSAEVVTLDSFRKR